MQRRSRLACCAAAAAALLLLLAVLGLGGSNGYGFGPGGLGPRTATRRLGGGHAGVVVSDSEEDGHEKVALNGTNPDGGKRAFSLEELIHPSTLAPYYLMPLILGTHVALTFMIFGFGLRFEPEGEWYSVVVLLLARSPFALMFIALACRTAWHDYQKFTACGAQGFKESTLALVLIMTLSPNLTAAAAIYRAIYNASPQTLLDAQPTYPTIPFTGGLPILPCSTSWVPFLTWVYAAVLLVYAWPLQLVASICSTLICCLKCKICCQFQCALFCCGWRLFLAIISLGLWATVRTLFWESWHATWGFWYYLFLGTYSSVVLGLLSLPYVCTQVHPLEWISFALRSQEKEGISVASACLWEVNPGLAFQFEHPYTSMGGGGGDKALARRAMKAGVVSSTFMNMTAVWMMQVLAINMCRFLAADTVEDWEGAWVKTMSERTTDTYLASLRALPATPWHWWEAL